MARIPIFNTERLTLRPLLNTDDQQIFALRCNETVNRYIDRKPSVSINDAQNFIQAILQSKSLYWGITLNGVNELIGTICLFNLANEHRKAEIGYELLPDFQGKGIMQETMVKVVDFAFQHLKMNRLEAYTHCDNQASTQLLEKLNFEKQLIDEEDMMLFVLTHNS
jgi:ribosomal-protein-alanine N-acetyltransferase